MAFSIPSFNQIRNLILQEVRNQTGIDAPDDSDAAIRADGEAAVVEGLYQHQKWIERQLFIATADEPFGHSILLKENGIYIEGDLFVNGEVKDRKGTMQQMREIYNQHKNGNSPTPNPQM